MVQNQAHNFVLSLLSFFQNKTVFSRIVCANQLYWATVLHNCKLTWVFHDTKKLCMMLVLCLDIVKTFSHLFQLYHLAQVILMHLEVTEQQRIRSSGMSSAAVLCV